MTGRIEAGVVLRRRRITHHNVAVKNTKINVYGLLGKRSPNGQIRSKPTAYPDCINVGTLETSISVTWKSAAKMFKMGWL